MSKVAQDVLEEFGRAVKRARALKGWQLDKLSTAMGGTAGKSFLSNIEKGKRSISPTTVGRLIKALQLDESWIDKFLQSDVDPDTEETKTNRDADRLLRMVESDEDAPGAGQELLMLLASEYAEGSYIELRTAYTGLRGALQAAADMRARGNMPDNTGGQFQAVMTDVTRLNDEGDRDGAAAALDDAQARVEQEYEAIFTQQLNQDRLRNRPDDAAKRHIANLNRQAPAGGVWKATRILLIELREHGKAEVDPFDLRVALELAEIQWKKAKGPKRSTALSDLGLCHLALGEISADNKHLRLSLKALGGFLKLVSKKSDPINWTIAQHSLGTALGSLGEREEDSSRLLEAVVGHCQNE